MSEALAGYAVSGNTSRGRVHPEPPHPYRSDFERDRDRVIHCSAFRRLEGKTQVFTPGLDDYYRSRLTHTIEVAQIGRTIGKALRLNESLTEAICLAHDLGHPPFGHAGEKVLNDLMAEHGGDIAPDRMQPALGGFEHNRQSLRIVDLLEHPYPDFAGLNLMYETRLGLARHRTPYDAPQVEGFDERNCSLEGQVADLADRIAVSTHDLEDGMRAGLISRDRLIEVEIFAEAERRIKAGEIKDRTIRRTRTAKTIMDRLVGDCIDESGRILAKANITTVGQVYDTRENLIVLSAESEAELVELERFLLENFYRAESLIEAQAEVKIWLERLFERLCEQPELMPGYFQRLAEKEGSERTVCDYIAGMTDRFAITMVKGD